MHKCPNVSASSPTNSAQSFLNLVLQLYFPPEELPQDFPHKFSFCLSWKASSLCPNGHIAPPLENRILSSHPKHQLFFLWLPGQKHHRNAMHILGSLMLSSNNLFSTRVCDKDEASRHLKCKRQGGPLSHGHASAGSGPQWASLETLCQTCFLASPLASCFQAMFRDGGSFLLQGNVSGCWPRTSYWTNSFPDTTISRQQKQLFSENLGASEASKDPGGFWETAQLTP